MPRMSFMEILFSLCLLPRLVCITSFPKFCYFVSYGNLFRVVFFVGVIAEGINFQWLNWDYNKIDGDKKVGSKKNWARREKKEDRERKY